MFILVNGHGTTILRSSRSLNVSQHLQGRKLTRLSYLTSYQYNRYEEAITFKSAVHIQSWLARSGFAQNIGHFLSSSAQTAACTKYATTTSSLHERSVESHTHLHDHKQNNFIPHNVHATTLFWSNYRLAKEMRWYRLLFVSMYYTHESKFWQCAHLE